MLISICQYRSSLGAGNPAQHPDCCRVVESVCIKLALIYSSPRKSQGKTISRWTNILRSYRRIREMVLNNNIIMARTNLQLVELNQYTLTQW